MKFFYLYIPKSNNKIIKSDVFIFSNLTTGRASLPTSIGAVFLIQKQIMY